MTRREALAELLLMLTIAFFVAALLDGLFAVTGLASTGVWPLVFALAGLLALWARLKVRL